MTDKAKLEKIKSLADKMYNAAFNLTTDASLLRRAMDDYHQFIIYEYHKEEPVSEKKCMFTKDSYTDEDRMVLCEDCDEKCEHSKKEEPISEDEIEKQFKVGDVVVYVSRQPAYSGFYILGNANDLSIGYSNCNEPFQIALRNCTIASEVEHSQFFRELNLNGYKWNNDTLRIEKIEPVSEELEKVSDKYSDDVESNYLNDMFDRGDIMEAFEAGAKWQKQKDSMPVSEELEQAAVEAFKEIVDDERNSFLEIFKAGAKWQKEQMMAKAIDGIAIPDDGEVWCDLKSFNFKESDKCKVILIKED